MLAPLFLLILPEAQKPQDVLKSAAVAFGAAGGVFGEAQGFAVDAEHGAHAQLIDRLAQRTGYDLRRPTDAAILFLSVLDE